MCAIWNHLLHYENKHLTILMLFMCVDNDGTSFICVCFMFSYRPATLQKILINTFSHRVRNSNCSIMSLFKVHSLAFIFISFYILICLPRITLEFVCFSTLKRLIFAIFLFRAPFIPFYFFICESKCVMCYQHFTLIRARQK